VRDIDVHTQLRRQSPAYFILQLILLTTRCWLGVMKSRIPHTKSADSQDKRPQQSRGDSSTVHASLKLLGAPHLEDEEFFRLYRGSLADVLLFVSEHMKGRRQVALARAEIHQYVPRMHPVKLHRSIGHPDCGSCVLSRI
jgi:hypothetical protein